MPESVSDWVTSLAPAAVVVVSALYAAGAWLRGRARRRAGRPVPGVYPGSREHVGDLNLGWWRSLSTAEQRAEDEKAIRASASHDLEAAEERERAAQAALARRTAERLAVTRAGEINALYRP